jgi:hypothetical protein
VTQHDLCKCGAKKRTKNRQCAACRGYGNYRHVMPSGYIRVWAPGHPAANADGYVLEHRKVVVDAGLTIPYRSHVHHINGDRADNDLKNLEIKTVEAHRQSHATERGYVDNQYGRFPPKAERICERCGVAFRPWTSRSKFCSRDCSNRRNH